MTAFQLVLAAVLICANSFFVSVEFALVAAPRPPLLRLAEQGNRRSRIAVASTSDLGRQLAGAQFGITVTSLALGYISESAIAGILQDTVAGLGGAISHGVAGALALGLMVVLQMLLGEMIPKNAAVAAPVKMALLVAPPNRVFVKIFMPIIATISWLASQGVKLLGVSPSTEVDESRTPVELAHILERSRREGVIGEAEHSLLSGALDFGEQTVDSHLVSRSQIIASDRSASVSELEKLMVSSGQSRIPVYREDIDDADSFVHVKDLLRIQAGDHTVAVPDALLRPLPSIARGELLDDVLVRMRRQREHIALVRDDSRKVVGLITLEDVLESLVGDFEDESDR